MKYYLQSASLFYWGILATLSTSAQYGMLDTSLVPPNFMSGGTPRIYVSAIQSDGKIIAGGSFESVNGSSINGLVRLDTDGSLDVSFGTGNGVSSQAGYQPIVNAIAIQGDGKILVTGSFTHYNGTPFPAIIRLHPDGNPDLSFNPGYGPTGSTSNTPNNGGTVSAIAIQPDGKIIIGGNFINYNGTNIRNIARLNPDGTLDNTFAPGTGTTAQSGGGEIYNIVTQPDGKIIISGLFESYDGIARNEIARINQDGSLDTTFNPGTGVAGISFPRIQCIALQPDGKVLIGGTFNSYSGTPRNRIARLNANGSLDTTFHVGTGANGAVMALAVQSDGKIVMGGDFGSYRGNNRVRLARILNNGNIDSTFTVGTGANNYVESLSLQPNGKIIITGRFSSYNGTNRRCIARINGSSMISQTPSTPSLLTATPVNSIELNWQDNSDNEDGFYIESSQDTLAGIWSQIASVGTDITTYLHTGLTLGEDYFYRVRAYNSYGHSAYSNIAGATDGLIGISTSQPPHSLKIYPNPAGNFVTIENISPGLTIRITDITGKEVYHTNTKHDAETINTETWVNGFYHIRIAKGHTNIDNKNLIINR